MLPSVNREYPSVLVGRVEFDSPSSYRVKAVRREVGELVQVERSLLSINSSDLEVIANEVSQAFIQVLEVPPNRFVS